MFRTGTVTSTRARLYGTVGEIQDGSLSWLSTGVSTSAPSAARPDGLGSAPRAPTTIRTARMFAWLSVRRCPAIDGVGPTLYRYQLVHSYSPWSGRRSTPASYLVSVRPSPLVPPVWLGGGGQVLKLEAGLTNAIGTPGFAPRVARAPFIITYPTWKNSIPSATMISSAGSTLPSPFRSSPVSRTRYGSWPPGTGTGRTWNRNRSMRNARGGVSVALKQAAEAA